MPPPPPNGYGIQGNVQWSKALRDQEMENASLAARQKKAMMQSMATTSQQPPVITTAEQYLQAHRPATPPAGEQAPSPLRRDVYVPQFENAAPARPSAPDTPAFETGAAPAAQEKKGLFSFLKGKEKAEFANDAPPPPAAAYPEPSTSMETPAPSIDTAGQDAALAAATQGGAGKKEEKPSFFGRLLKREKATEPSSTGDTTLSDPIAFPIPGEPMGQSEPPVPVPGSGGDLFDRRQAATGGPAGAEVAVLSTTQATVDGVLVRLHEGNTVTVIERSGDRARIRLPDGREGTVDVSALGR